MARWRGLGLAAVAGAVVVGGSVLTGPAGGTPRARADVARAAQEGPPFTLTIPGIASDGQPLYVSLSTEFVYQGGAVRVAASGGASGWATIFGRSYPLVGDGAGGLEGFLGIGTEDMVGHTWVTVSVEGPAGWEEHVVGVTVLKTQWTVDYITLPPGVGELLDPAIIQAEENRLRDVYSGRTTRKWSGQWDYPVELGPNPGPCPSDVAPACVSGYFGEQRSFNGGPVGGHHGGTDFGAGAGTPVYATNSGIAVLAETLKVRGNMVILDHGGGVLSGYAHMQELAVQPGAWVEKGQVIGYVGTTGLSTGPHLHWELSVSGVLVDGLRWVDGTQGF